MELKPKKCKADRNLRRSLKKKSRLYRQAKKRGNWDRFRHYQKECKRTFRRAEWNHVNRVINEGLENKNSKPFWNCVKSKKQDNIGTAPLKQHGNLITDSRMKADILVDQFESVFTKTTNSDLPDLTKNKKYPQINNITIETA